MFQDDSLKIRLYFWTVLFFSLGTFAGFHGFYWLGILLWILGAVVAIHIFLVSLIRERRYYIESEKDKLDAQTKLYATIRDMNEETKYILGLSYVPKEVTVKKDTTKEVGNEFSQTWKKLPIAPYKLKVIAQAVINGQDFTVRKWVGDKEHQGLLTRPEWDALHDEMERLGMLEQNTNDPRGGFSWTSFGEDVMAQVVRDTL